MVYTKRGVIGHAVGRVLVACGIDPDVPMVWEERPLPQEDIRLAMQRGDWSFLMDDLPRGQLPLF